ncbi:MAG: hypothetical protein WBW14_01285, partial [Candidatus Acidiferrum sp.]
QASDVGSIPIARSINPVDAVGFTGFSPQNFFLKPLILDAVGRELLAEWGFGRGISGGSQVRGLDSDPD